MGRPLLPPTITPIPRKDGTVRAYLITATVGGKQRKKVRRTMDQAKDLAAKWQGCRDESIQHLPTTLTIPKLRAAEAADPLWDSLGLTPIEAAAWMVKNYERPGAYRWTEVIEEFRQSRRHKHHLKDDKPDTNHIVNLVAAARDFADSTKRELIGKPTLAEVEGWLTGRGGFNQLLGDIRSFFLWCIKRGKLKEDPTAAIDRQMPKRRKLPTTQAPDASANMMLTLEVQAPEWVPYAAMCLFGFMRPWTREGESARLDQDLRLGNQVLFPAGVMIHGKNGSARIVPWKLTGPLRAWLTAYPFGKGLFPVDSTAKAERAWSVWRTTFALTKDELRHTGITAAVHASGSFAEVAIAADNSEAIIRRNYLGRWSDEDAQKYAAIRPKYSASNRPQVGSASVFESA